MNGLCRVSHCGEPSASRFSPYCRRHKSAHRRQGAPNQSAITVTELKPFRDRVMSRIAKNVESPLWPHLETCWSTLVAEAKFEAERSVSNRYQRSAAQELLSIEALCQPPEIIITTLAMFILWYDMPWRFRSDAALRVQIARRVRALSGHHTGQIFDHLTGKKRRIYREMTPKAAAIIGQKLSVAFGATGIQFALLDRREREETEYAREAIATAIRKIK